MQPPMIIRSIDQTRRILRAWRAAGERIALIPTMGNLHEGHLSLVTVAQRHATKTVASIFANPTQFGSGEDFAAYPRTEAQDAERLGTVGCDLIFAPSTQEMYPAGFASTVHVDGVTAGLCGAVRTDHFDGVATVVAKLLNQIQPDVAIFGEKDWQQLITIRRLVRDLNLPVEILGAATIRDPDGLALSSRNAYLTAAERQTATRLYKALTASATLIAEGKPVDHVVSACRQALADSDFSKIEYVEARRAHDLAPLMTFDPAKPCRLFAAAHLGRARLIDNVPITRATPKT